MILASKLIALAVCFPLQEDIFPLDSVLATVNGKAITRTSVESLYIAMQGSQTREEILRSLVSIQLLDQKAKESDLKVSEQRLKEVMARRVSNAGGWDSYQDLLLKQAVSVEEDRKQVRDALLADLYIDHSLGRVPGSSILRHELARMIDVAPREIQDYYREHRDRFRHQREMIVGRFIVKKGDYPSGSEAREAALSVRTDAFFPGSGSLKEAASKASSEHYSELRILDRNSEELRPDLLAFVRTAPVSVVSPVMETDAAFVIVVKVEENPGKTLSFAESQPTIASILQEQKYQEARAVLVEKLLQEADIWPESLFNREEGD